MSLTKAVRKKPSTSWQKFAVRLGGTIRRTWLTRSAQQCRRRRLADWKPWRSGVHWCGSSTTLARKYCKFAGCASANELVKSPEPSGTARSPPASPATKVRVGPSWRQPIFRIRIRAWMWSRRQSRPTRSAARADRRPTTTRVYVPRIRRLGSGPQLWYPRTLVTPIVLRSATASTNQDCSPSERKRSALDHPRHLLRTV